MTGIPIFMHRSIGMMTKAAAIAAATTVAFVCLCTGAFTEERSPKEDLEHLQRAFIRIAEEVGPSVVSISSMRVGRMYTYSWSGPTLEDFLRGLLDPDPQQQFRIQSGLGSGFIIDDEGHILTNEHVIRGADEIEVTLSDGRKLKGTVKGFDTTADLALVKVDEEDLPKAVLGDSEKVRTGEWTLAIGNPFAFGVFTNNSMPTVTVGVVSAVHRTLSRAGVSGRYYGDLIQTDAAINPGNSGGPLVNLDGEVIGINAAIISPSGASAGIGFAIPVNRAKDILPYLKEGKVHRKGWLGVAIQGIDSATAAELGLPDTVGVLVRNVLESSPAEEAEFREGDVIRTYNGAAVYSADDLIWKVTHTLPGETAKIVIIREGVEIGIEVRIGSMDDKAT